MPVIMGRKTFESLGKPLNGRTNIVVTGNTGWKADGVWVAGNLEEAIDKAKTIKTREIFIIGGGSIYQSALPLVSRLYLTRVNTRVENADTWFPAWMEPEWDLLWEHSFKKDAKHLFDYSFQCLERRNHKGREAGKS